MLRVVDWRNAPCSHSVHSSHHRPGICISHWCMVVYGVLGVRANSRLRCSVRCKAVRSDPPYTLRKPYVRPYVRCRLFFETPYVRCHGLNCVRPYVRCHLHIALYIYPCARASKSIFGTMDIILGDTITL